MVCLFSSFLKQKRIPGTFEPIRDSFLNDHHFVCLGDLFCFTYMYVTCSCFLKYIKVENDIYFLKIFNLIFKIVAGKVLVLTTFFCRVTTR